VRISAHAAERLAQRGILLEMVESVLRAPMGVPEPGNNGNLVHEGRVGPRVLRVVVSPDGRTLVSAYWR